MKRIKKIIFDAFEEEVNTTRDFEDSMFWDNEDFKKDKQKNDKGKHR